MKKYYTEQEKKINSITSDVRDLRAMNAEADYREFLVAISDILCEFDTDIAIGVLENLGNEGIYQAYAIKVNYGY